MITRINIADSKAFTKLGFNEKGQIFARFSDKPEVKFIYSNVPTEKLEGLKTADSKGSYFARNIRHDKNITFISE